MGTCRELEITGAAVNAFARLLIAVGGPLRTHGCADGGLICEDRTSRARPNIWRISRDGEVLADRPYSFKLRAFVAAALPAGV